MKNLHFVLKKKLKSTVFIFPIWKAILKQKNIGDTYIYIFVVIIIIIIIYFYMDLSSQ